jgi:hypothetical protein
LISIVPLHTFFKRNPSLPHYGFGFFKGNKAKASKGNISPDEGLKQAVLEKPLSLEFPPFEVCKYDKKYKLEYNN